MTDAGGAVCALGSKEALSNTQEHASKILPLAQAATQSGSRLGI